MHIACTTPPRRLLRLPEALSIIGRKRRCIFNEIANGRGLPPIKIGRTSCWNSIKVEDYVTNIIGKQDVLPRAGTQPQSETTDRTAGRRGALRGSRQ